MSVYTGDPGTGIVPVAELPADNDKLKASDVDVPFERLFDNDAAIVARFLAQYRLIAGYEKMYYLEDSPAFAKAFTTTSYVSTESESELSLDVPALSAGDFVDVSFCGAASLNGSGDGWVRMSGAQAADGVHSDFVFGGCAARIENAMTGLRFPICWRSTVAITLGGILRIFFEGKIESAGPTARIHAPYSMTALHYRKV